MFTLELLEFLQTRAAVDVLAALRHDDRTHLAEAARLHRHFSAGQVAVLLETARLRQKAAARMGEAARQMFFTADALEQASHPLVVQHCRAMAAREVLDVCCGIGTDSIELARAGRQVTGIDTDEVRVAMARLNAHALGVDVRFEVAAAEHPWQAPGIFFDPGRRRGGKRIFHVEAYQPPLATLRQWQSAEVLVKLSPGVELAEVAAYGGTVTFISVDGDLREALLRVNPRQPQVREAVLLSLEGVQRFAPAAAELPAVLSEPQGWLLEPDPAIIRAGLVRSIGAEVGAAQMDEQIAYLTTAHSVAHPALRTWRIREWMPFSVRALKDYVRLHRIGRVTVKKRASPITPEALIAQLKPRGAGACVIALTRLNDAPIAIVCDEP